MYQCEKCGRRLKNENQTHYCIDKPTTIEEYILIQDESLWELLKQVQRTIEQAIPDAQQKLAWGMPTFCKKKNIIHFAAAKNHLGIYPGPAAIEHFAERLGEYKFSKGAIQFPYKKEIPFELIAEIARWNDRQVAE